VYGRGVRGLLEALPRYAELDDERVVRRLLTRAWLELAERRELGTGAQADPASAALLRRLGLALQVHMFLVPDVSWDTIRAAAFVAAEALDIASGYEHQAPPAIERVRIGLLYLIAGYDSNAAVVARGVEPEEGLEAAERYAIGTLVAFLAGGQPPQPPVVDEADLLHERVRARLWREIGDRVAAFVRWLRDPQLDTGDNPQPLVELAAALQADRDPALSIGHADIEQLLSLLVRAMDAAADRALRSVARPEEDELFADYLSVRCRSQPLLWPAAASYAREALPGPTSSAVIAVPTGAGKSAVADLALQHAVTRGWVLYLAPTNALVSQIRRQLRADHPGVTIREFLGGAEYTMLEGETLTSYGRGNVFVMTPEKCSLALRQSPEAFEEMTLCVLDEAHLLVDRGRGQLTELVLSEVLTRAPTARALLMSALIANPEALSDWLAGDYGHPSIVVREPWRPTRTLRAVVGVERQSLNTAARSAIEELADLPPSRRHTPFDAPLAALAGLYGPWSTDDEADYALITTAAAAPMRVSRPAGGGVIEIDEASIKVRPTVEALAQLLGERGEKVIAFLPRSKHDSFTAAVALPGFGAIQLSAEISALLDLASAELGVPSLLRETLGKGVGVHTSALLAEERRASEAAFEGEFATVLFATGTLAQGLNLPATTVIIGGTAIGYDPNQTADEKRSRERAQLLNAIGRAGRARVAARSLALVVPTRPPVFDDQVPASAVLERAEFLAEEDASTTLLSAMRPLLQRLDSGRISVETLGASDQLALAYLAPTRADAEFSDRLVRNTWGAFQLRIRDELDRVMASLAALAEAARAAGDAPGWAVEAARRAGVPITVTAELARFISTIDLANAAPNSVSEWTRTLVDALESLSVDVLSLVLDNDAFTSTAVQGLWSEDDRPEAFAALRAVLDTWLAGSALAVVGGALHGGGRIADARRGQSNPIPRTIRAIENGIAFGVTRAAGAIAAVIELAIEAEELPPLSAVSQQALALLPLALRYGAADDVPLALMRAGARPRAVAHLLASSWESPNETDPERLVAWAIDQLANIEDLLVERRRLGDDSPLLTAFFISRAAR
jgi:superfamily II DNA/RNA helicase